ncbi:MAG TPA: sigma-70 family RNA polymerase sigma factor, partial [Verrucomicrobiae bacterium]|nr:sigma-70 family RNA polymerase sigma factor [Verrucomicrobiae bacterium]
MTPTSQGRTNAADSAAGFHTTHWTVVLAARENDGAAARTALTNLCQTYWLPLYTFIRRQGLNPHQAEDLTQEFFCQFLERESLASV